MICRGAGGTGKSAALVAMSSHIALAASDADGKDQFVPVFEGAHEIPGFFTEKGSFKDHLQKRVIQCADRDAGYQYHLLWTSCFNADGKLVVARWPPRSTVGRSSGPVVLSAGPTMRHHADPMCVCVCVYVCMCGEGVRGLRAERERVWAYTKDAAPCSA